MFINGGYFKMATPTDGHENDQPGRNFCEIEASVPTGFEDLAKDEVKEKFGVSSVSHRGKINFWIPTDKVKEVRRARDGQYSGTVV